MKTYIETHKERFFDELFSLLRIPSVSSLEQHKPDMQRCADRLVELLLEAGADQAATGENSVVVACSMADLIIGPVGIVIADAMLGEITPKMAAAVGQSRARKILIPFKNDSHMIIGVPDYNVSRLVEAAVEAAVEVIG